MIQKETWRYLNEINGIQINKIANLYSQQNVKEEGDSTKGMITFHSQSDADDVWGAASKVQISWEKVEPTEYHQGLKVKETIRMFSAIEVVATKKKNQWHLSHEMTIWWGNRQQVVRRRFYASQIVHCIVFCELTQRLFEVHAICLGNHYQTYENAILDIMNSLQCHG